MSRRLTYRIENNSTGKVDTVFSKSAAFKKAKQRAARECGSVGIYRGSEGAAGVFRYEDTSAIWSSDHKPCKRRR